MNAEEECYFNMLVIHYIIVMWFPMNIRNSYLLIFKYWPILSSFCPFYFSIGVATKCEEISLSGHKILPGHLFNFEKIPHQVRKFGQVANLILRKSPIGSEKMPGL